MAGEVHGGLDIDPSTPQALRPRHAAPMASIPAAQRPSVYEAFLAVPDTRVAEIIRGELRTFPRPAFRHALAASVLGGDLSGPFHRGKGGPGGWILLDEPELH